ncbi:MAG: glycosyltransferase family 39 protein [Rhodobacteraceae bacterium]|jgi:4-amino-4-deoxy-L-arabinose transferase-like glycosyltransferase|nr:glycosyltransferase family 39 protein [Paracoccaceae bacterium]
MIRINAPRTMPALPRPALARLAPGLAALALAVAWAVLLPQLRPLLPVDETRYLTVAWEMHAGGSLIVPHLNGAIYAHKPPLLFWLINLVWALTGVSETAARLVAPAFAVIAVGLTWRLGRLLWPAQPETGGRAALILASTGAFVVFGSLTMFDTMLTVATLAGIAALVAMDRGPGLGPTALFGAALALGVYAKGPVILVHLAPLALSRPVWSLSGAAPSYWRWLARLGLALIVALALVAIWLGPALVFGGPQYRDEVLWRQSAGRMVHAFDHARPVWFFVAALPLLLWPWGWRLALLRELGRRRLRQDRRSRLLAIWAGATLVVFSLISGKQLHYLLPALPAAALAIAAGPVPRRSLAPAVLALAVLAPVAAWLVLLLTGRAWIDGRPVTVLTAGGVAAWLVLGLALVLGLGLAGRRAPLLGWALIAPTTMLAVHLALMAPMRAQYDTEGLGAMIGAGPPAGIGISGYRYQGEFGFAARLTQPIETVAEDAVDAWIAAHPGGLLITATPPADPARPGLRASYGSATFYLDRL